jgi:hypothetical protein
MALHTRRRFAAHRPLIRTLLVLLGYVSLCPFGVWAQPAPSWEPITASERGRFYIDSASVRKTEGTVRIRTLLDYAQPQTTHNGKAFRSALSQMEIDCQADMGRIVKMTYYTGLMAGGQPVETQGMIQDWQDIAPESPVRRMAKRVCK